MANLCKWTPPPPFKEIQDFIPYMNMILRTKNKQAIVHALWGLSYVTNRSTESVKRLTEFVSLKTVVELVANEELEVVAPALRIVGNVCAGDEADVDLVLASDGICALAHIVLMGHHPCLLKEVCWILSNIATGPTRHIEAILDFIPILSELAINSDNPKVLLHIT
eukprot:TRINITY_DN11089_c0_g2_i1.p2 TRINITY_DN11089_c0_g2~~TRINITY_DN11089_c0_g2_i1.p2  ORF type:complete len:166 (-),score=36.24 TRINITY_DN11089_c0_g2_i1:479-976(-)